MIPTAAPSSASRLQRLSAWSHHCLHNRMGPGAALELQAISGDAGFRNYYRVTGVEPPCLAVDAPPTTEKNQAFCHVARLFRQHGVHAPQVFAVDEEEGFLLLEDFGDVMYWPLLQQSQKSGGQQHLSLYADAESCLLRLAAIPVAESGLSPYDEQKLQGEMDLFPEWYVERLLQHSLTEPERALLLRVNRQLVCSAREQPQVVVHRDFHCRNLMVTSHNNPGVIDFQDAVIGPFTYDLVSLYRDCYIRWPQQAVRQWVNEYYQRSVQAGRIAVDEVTFVRWFDWMGLQRHLKVLGIFARLYLRDHKSGYLQDLPLVMHYTLFVAKQYPEFADFVSWFERCLLPRAKQQSWYRELG